MINIVYVLARILLIKDKTNKVEVLNVCQRLKEINPSYKIVGTIPDAVAEWADFFEYDEEGNIIANKEDLTLFRLIFSDILPFEQFEDINKAIDSVKKEPFRLV